MLRFLNLDLFSCSYTHVSSLSTSADRSPVIKDLMSSFPKRANVFIKDCSIGPLLSIFLIPRQINRLALRPL